MRIGPWLVMMLVLSGCGKSCRSVGSAAAPSASSSGTVLQPKLGDGSYVQPLLAFAIETVYEHQTPTATAPFHTAGGDWTFFDARMSDGLSFGFGFQMHPAKSGVAFGRALWTVPNPDAGATLVQRFATVFRGTPPSAGERHPLQPKQFSLAVLGERTQRNDDGSFSGNGTWCATKLFLQRPGIEAEVFFNFDLTGKRGEFAEKDRDYADDMLAFMVSELRDGPLPAQTPENDPRVTLRGPKPGQFRAIGPRNARFLRWESKQRALIAVSEGAGTRLLSIAVEGEPRETEVARLARHLTQIQCAKGSDDPCVVEETESPETLLVGGSATYSLLERAQKRVTPLVGPWNKEGSTLRSSVSDDGAVIGLASYSPRQKGQPRKRTLHFIQTAKLDSALAFTDGDEWLDVMGWSGQGEALRALLRAGSDLGEKANHHWLAVDPRTGTKTVIDSPPVDARFDPNVAPDGKHRFRCQGAEQVVIVELPSGREQQFPISERERRLFAEDCPVRWRGSSYLEYTPIREGFVDIQTLKLSFPFPEDEELGALEWDPGFNWLIRTEDQQLQVARISASP